MPWQLKTEDQHFKAEWSNPMQGLDTSALAPYTKGLVDCDNFLIQNQSFIATLWTRVTFGDQTTFPTTSTLLGFGELSFPVAGGSGPADVGDKFFYIAQASSSDISAHVSDYIGQASTNVGSVSSDGGQALGQLTWKTINQTTYLSAPGLTQLFQIAIDPVTSAITFTELTDYLGCKFLNEFNGRLIALNVYQLQTGPPPFVQNFPYQIAWSAGGEQYGIWNPLDISSNATGAGFNNLPDVEDEITGALFIGPTVYIIRRAGITEMTALNSGIQPFNFDHMWASHKGVGTVFPDTIAQYGPKGAFVANDDIYTLGLDGIATIGGSAKRAIYRDLQAASIVKGAMVGLNINDCPELCYVLAMQLNDQTAGTFNVRTYVYGFESKQWMILTLGTGTTIGNVSNLAYITSLLMSNTILTTFQDNVSCDSIVFATQGLNQVPMFWYIPLEPSNTTQIGLANESRLNFPPCRVQTLKDITIDSVVIYAEADLTGGNAFIHPSVDGIPYTEIELGVGPDSAKNIYTSYPANQVAVTTLQPALLVEVSGTVALGEISMEGTIGPGRRP